ncbi:hypothetical protein BDW22DRAFT_1363735 [Trametopsis cervina]|nr:hypothetical protein BDW22DRAFT_1363735 [Trametopsis cervina]
MLCWLYGLGSLEEPNCLNPTRICSVSSMHATSSAGNTTSGNTLHTARNAARSPHCPTCLWPRYATHHRPACTQINMWLLPARQDERHCT